MQTANYTVNSGGGVALWRGIPVQIEISGIEDVSGDWLFLVDNDLADGVVLSGMVAADGETLVVTLENMNTVELAEAIQGRSILQCRATLTDGVSRVYLIPLTVRNRAVEGTPTPVAEYYTKAQVDALIAAIPTAQVQANWNETDPNSKAYIQNKPVIPSVPVQSVNSKTGNVVLNAADVGAVSKDGLPIVALESSTIPAPGAVYTFTPSAVTEFAFPTPVSGKDNAFRLVLTMPDPAVAVTFPAGLTWKFATPALAAGTTSELAFAWTGFAWEGWAVPDMSEYALLNGNNSFVGNQTFTGGFSAKTSNNWNILKNSAPSSGLPNATNTEVTLGDTGIGCLYLRGANWEFISGSYAIYVNNRTSSNKVFRLGAWPAVRDSAAGYVQITPTSLDVKFDLNITNGGDLTFTPAGASESTTLSALVARIEALEQAQN